MAQQPEFQDYYKTLGVPRTATQAEIGTAVSRVQQVDGALSNISNDVGEVHKLLADIAADNLAQSTAVTQVTAAVNSMDQATQQNAAMVEQLAASAQSLRGQCRVVLESMSVFRLKQGAP